MVTCETPDETGAPWNNLSINRFGSNYGEETLHNSFTGAEAGEAEQIIQGMNKEEPIPAVE